MASPSAHTLQDLAEICRVSKMTVSRALRGQPGVSPAVAERVRAAAEKAGYQLNPAVGSVMRLLRRRQTAGYRENLAFVWTHPGAHPLPLLVPWRDHASFRAEHLGYRLDEFFLRAPGMTSSRLRSILRARGIRGILFAPDIEPHLPRVSFNVAGFAAVLLGSSLLNRGLARVQFDHFHLVQLALRHVRKAGYRRPALFLSPSIDARTQGRLRAGFLMHSPTPPNERPQLIYLANLSDRATMLAWLRRHRADVVLFIEKDLPRLFARPPAAHVPPLVALSRHNHTDDVPGILQSAEAMGRAAVDLVVAQIQRHEFGRIPSPQKVMLEGVWSGTGLPRAK
jgi:DNA-binding LacI/PurR family transcriptional regulator